MSCRWHPQRRADCRCTPAAAATQFRSLNGGQSCPPRPARRSRSSSRPGIEQHPRCPRVRMQKWAAKAPSFESARPPCSHQRHCNCESEKWARPAGLIVAHHVICLTSRGTKDFVHTAIPAIANVFARRHPDRDDEVISGAEVRVRRTFSGSLACVLHARVSVPAATTQPLQWRKPRGPAEVSWLAKPGHGRREMAGWISNAQMCLKRRVRRWKR